MGGNGSGSHRRQQDPIPAGPFAKWANRTVERLAVDFDTVNDARVHFLERIGWPGYVRDGKADWSRIDKYAKGKQLTIEREDAEEAIDAYGMFFWDVYDEEFERERLASQARDRRERQREPGYKHRVDFGRSYVFTEEQLIEAHAMHEDGMSAREIARSFYDEGRVYSSSPRAAAAALLGAWHRRGWYVRPQGEATALKNVQRAVRPICSHVHRMGRRKGQQCTRRCVGNDRWCWKHNPEQIAVGIARARGEEVAA